MKISGLPTSDPVKGRRIVGFLTIFIGVVVVVLVSILILVMKPTPQVTYSCAVDPTLGAQPIDLCSFVPEGVRQRSNVVVTGGMATYSGVIKVKGDKTVYYNVLTPAQQLNTVVKTPGPILFFEKFGFFWGILGGMILILVLIGLLYLVKGLLGERKRVLARQGRQEKIQQRKSSEKKLGFDTVRI